MEIQDFNLHPEIMTRTSFYVQIFTKKLGLFLEGHSTFTFE